ncbi:MAG: hypothetical protein AB7V43_07015 [Acidimicrobiia bacterium]
MPTGSSGRISREDIESKLRAIQGETTAKADSAKASVAKIGAGVGVLFLILVFLLGQRRGKRKTTTVEIRRF